tara:strand:- start:1603 stop:1782 length:180 start_codon:yes stop_codon:yes gene_type:complete
MKNTPSKNNNFNNYNDFSTGCDPCLNSAKKIERKIKDKKVSELKLEEIKKIVSSFFNDK